MGDLNVKLAKEGKQSQQFMQALLNDLQVMERMIEDDVFERGITRIGAEQELCLVDNNNKPAPINLEILKAANNDLLTSELAKFNIETNLTPLKFDDDCLSVLEQEIHILIGVIRKHAKDYDAHPIMCGILPTIRKFDISNDNLTPLDRYEALMTAIGSLRGTIELKIKGIDELNLHHDSPLLEACNTGFQVHLQVHPDEFVKMYNIAQAITAPVMAISVNSPLLFGKRLWNETRIALFQQSLDTRATSPHLRESSPRVTFGTGWLKKSILEIYKEDISRFRVWLSSNTKEDSMKIYNEGIIPNLKALQVHNSTIYRWNRACYGVAKNVPHLRIENRILPSGPTVIDEMANAAFWLGLMEGMGKEHKNIHKSMEFDHASSNFTSAARIGMDTNLRWLKGKTYSAQDLIKSELIPLAKEGLKSRNIRSQDISKYMDVIQERNEANCTGSFWILESFTKLRQEASREEAVNSITASMIENQETGEPVHKWPLAKHAPADDNWNPGNLLVEEFMTTDLFTVHKEDILDLVVDMMNWQKIRYMPVENKSGELIGLMTMRKLMKHMGKVRQNFAKNPPIVKDVMIKNPITINPEATIVEAMNLMKEHAIGCLPVIKEKKLVGIVTEQDFLKVSARFIHKFKGGG